jgi:putative FmdB family regulatory protein
MPFYEYQCKNCGHELEAMQKVSDTPLKKCPHCGKSQLQRLMSAPVFRLKGGGWYETDFKGDQDNKRNLADRPEAEASKDESAGTDVKTDAKAGDAKGNEAKPVDAKTADGAANEGAKAKEKPIEKSADKPAEKAPARSAKPAAKRTAPKRAGRPTRKPAAKVKRRR